MPKHKIAFITMTRAGSKRLPGKLLKKINGKPLYLYTLEFGKKLVSKFENSKYFILNDPAYSNIYIPKGKNIKIIERQPEFVTDAHRTNKEILSYGIDAEFYCILQCTSPFRDMRQTVKNIKLFLQGYFDAGFNARIMPQGFYYNQAGGPANFSQDDRTDNGAPKLILYKETGSFYIFKRAQLLKKHCMDVDLLLNRKIFFDPYCIDIDTKKDLKEAQKIARRAGA